MKLLTVLGTRPEIIRLSRVIAALDEELGDGHVLVDTGQNFEDSLSRVFFEQLGVRAPDRRLGVRAESFAGRVAQVMTGAERALLEENADALLVLGDTDSGLAAFVAKRLGIRVFHMEAGNRCFDDRVPEEVNRRVIDHSSDVLMPYTATAPPTSKPRASAPSGSSSRATRSRRFSTPTSPWSPRRASTRSSASSPAPTSC